MLAHNSRAPFSAYEEALLSTALMTGLAAMAEAGPQGRLRALGWLARVLWRYDRTSTVARVATYLATIQPDGGDIRVREIIRVVHIGETETLKALERLAGDGFIDLRPSVRIGAKWMRLSLFNDEQRI